MKILKNIEEAGVLLNHAAAVGVMPTDTIYGLVARASDKEAVGRLYAIKNRGQKPGTVIAASIEQLIGLGIPRRYLLPVARYWPNPISVVVPTAPGLQYLDLGKFSLAVRIPANTDLQKLLEQTGPLMTSSANHPGKEPASTVLEAQAYFHDQVDFYVDGGTVHGQNSTVIRIVDDAVEVLREGAVKVSENGEIVS